VRVLIAEGQAMFRQGLRVLLGQARDLTVVGEAADGVEAVERARALRPDVVLMDARLPRGDGVEATAALRRELPGVRVIVLGAGRDEPGAVARAVGAGALGYVAKDGRVEDLIDAVRRVARGEAALAGGSLTALVRSLQGPPAAVPAPGAGPLDRLSPREREVLALLAGGRRNRDISRELCVTESTVRAHIHNVLEKLHLDNRVQAATFALGLRAAAPDRGLAATA
jgi:DNA-binding NarL/FixJ family response regulator